MALLRAGDPLLVTLNFPSDSFFKPIQACNPQSSNGCQAQRVLPREAIFPRRRRTGEVISERDGAGPSSSMDPTLSVRLLFLAFQGNLAGMEQMVASGADVDYRDMNRRTALHIAACEGFVAIIHFLLQNGAFVAAEDRWGGTVRRSALPFS